MVCFSGWWAFSFTFFHIYNFSFFASFFNVGLVVTARSRTAGTQVLEVQARAVGWRARAQARRDGCGNERVRKHGETGAGAARAQA